ncbi:MAG: CHRD domain-containing protein [Planctomycetota bacterium]
MTYLCCLVVFSVAAFAPVVAGAQLHYAAKLDRFQVLNNESFSTATGTAQFTLIDTPEGPRLDYALQLDGLNLEPVPENRTDPNDVVGIHLHLHVPDVIGPHILNIFGIPGHDDDDLVVDYENESLTGAFEISDASRDPATGALLPQAFPLTTKVIDNWLDELADGRLYIAVHSRDRAANAQPGVDIRGNIFPVPEPTSLLLLLAGLPIALSGRARANRADAGPRCFA